MGRQGALYSDCPYSICLVRLLLCRGILRQPGHCLVCMCPQLGKNTGQESWPREALLEAMGIGILPGHLSVN